MCTYCTVVRPVSCRRMWYAKPVEVTVVFRICSPVPSFSPDSAKDSMMMFLSAMATPGWPSCVDSCSGHGNCSHIGVCSCERGWRGDACAEAVCAAHCTRHGICVAGNAGASCACDAGYVGADCSRRAPPPPPPLGSEMQARQLGEVPPGPPVHHNFTVCSRLNGLPRVLQPVGALLPGDAVSAFLMSPGTAGKKPLLLHVRLGQQLKLADSHDVDDGAFLSEAYLPPVVTLARRAPSHSDTGIASALQPDSPVRTATASAVDWGRGTAYVALSTGNSGGAALLQLGMCLPAPHSTRASGPPSMHATGHRLPFQPLPCLPQRFRP